MIYKSADLLHPWMAPKMERHIHLARTIGLNVKVIETWRSLEEQEKAYNKGRDPLTWEIIDPGAIVTKAVPGSSYHNITLKDGTPASLAYHLAIKLPGGGLYGFGESTIGPAGIFVLTALGMIGEQLGMRWGGRWKSRDWTHFEFRPAKGLNITKVQDWVKAGRSLQKIRRIT